MICEAWVSGRSSRVPLLKRCGNWGGAYSRSMNVREEEGAGCEIFLFGCTAPGSTGFSLIVG